MEFNNLSQLLVSFKNTFSKEKDIQENITRVIEKYTKQQSFSFKIQGDVIFIQTSPVIKQILFLKKKSILEELFLITGKTFSDIR